MTEVTVKKSGALLRMKDAAIPLPSNKSQNYSFQFSPSVKCCESNKRRFPVERRDKISLGNPVVT